MRTQISYHNLERTSHDGLDNAVHELARRHLDRYMSRFPPDTAELKVHLEKSGHRDYFHVSIQLSAPGAILPARQEGYDLKAVLRKAFDELEREVLRHISRLRQDEAWRRKERREELRRLKRATVEHPGVDFAPFRELVRPLLAPLQHFVKRELAALRARSDLNPGYPGAQDILDDVLARAWQQFAARTQDMDMELLHRLYQLAHQVLDEEVRKHRKEEGRLAPSSGSVPHPRDWTLDDQDQGVYEVWQPGEMIGPAGVVTADGGQAGDPELRRYFHEALARLPDSWRRALWLLQAEVLSLPDTARILHASEADVQRWIVNADDYLRERLREGGYTMAEQGAQRLYFTPAAAAPGQQLVEAFDEVARAAQQEQV